MFEHDPPVRLDHVDGLRGEVQPTHVQAPAERTPLLGDAFSHG